MASPKNPTHTVRGNAGPFVFELSERALEWIRMLRPLVVCIERHDKSLADQVRRGGTTVVLTSAEGRYSRKGNQPARYQEAMASANESIEGLRAAEAWGYLNQAQIQDAIDHGNRIIAMTWRLLHPRK